MKILDRYIIFQIIITFFFITIGLQIISVVIDLSQRIHRLENNQGSIKEALINYYPYWAIWLANTFSPITVFLSIIFVTSKLNNNSEITAILVSGISFKRITFPYFISAFIIVVGALMINYYILPIANKKKNQFHYQYLLNSKYKKIYENHQNISVQISNNEYLFIRNFSRKKNIGKECVYQKFNEKKLIYLIKAKNIFWNQKYHLYILKDYSEIHIKKNKDIFTKGLYIIKNFYLTPKELLPEEYIAETMTINELKKFIHIEKKRGSKNINMFLNEYYQRTSFPFSTFIFTILGLSIISLNTKKKNRTENHLMIGLFLSFLYIFFIELSKIYSIKNYITSYLSAWLPNIIFIIITIFFWNKKNNH